MKIFFFISTLVLLLIGLFILPKSKQKYVRFDPEVKVGTIYGGKMDRFNSDLKSLFEQNVKEASLVGGSKKLAQISLETIS